MPEDPRVDDTIGWIHYKKELPALAIKSFEEAIKKQPNYADAHYHLGMTYVKLADRTKARESLDRALKLDPKIGGEEARRMLAFVSQ
jgi:Tfp pilus assembly protein PilF